MRVFGTMRIAAEMFNEAKSDLEPLTGARVIAVLEMIGAEVREGRLLVRLQEVQGG